MRSSVKKRFGGTTRRVSHTAGVSRRAPAAATIRKLGDDWTRHWNARELDKVVAAYAEDAVYLPPHHKTVHGRDDEF